MISKGKNRREFIIEKQSPLQVSHYKPNVHDWLEHKINKGLILELYKWEGGKKGICCIRQNYAVIDNL